MTSGEGRDELKERRREETDPPFIRLISWSPLVPAHFGLFVSVPHHFGSTHYDLREPSLKGEVNDGSELLTPPAAPKAGTLYHNN